MPTYHRRKAAGGSGHAIGILLLDYRGPFVPGDVGNATTYDYPVIFRTVPGATSRRVFDSDPKLTPYIIDAARELEAQGVKGITSDCGFLLNYQDAVTASVSVPVFLSSLLQLPFVASLLNPSQGIAIVAANGKSLTPKLLSRAGYSGQNPLILKGLDDQPIFGGTVTGGCLELNTELLEQEVVQIATKLKFNNPNLGSILLECSMLPPYSAAVQKATQLPVFDFITMINFFSGCTYQKPRNFDLT